MTANGQSATAVAYAPPGDAHLIALSEVTRELLVAPGNRTTVELTVRNPSDIVENIQLEILGTASSWATLSPDHVNLFPGTTAEVTLTFHPSSDSPPEAGPVPFAVKATPQTDPFNSEVAESTITVGALARMTTSEDLQPANSHGRRRGRHLLLIENTGNVALPVVVSGDDPDGHLRFAIRPSPFELAYKESLALRIKVRAPSYMVTGHNRQHRFTLTVKADGVADKKVPAAFTQHPLISRRLLAVLAALAGIALLAYFLLRPTLKSAAAAESSTASHGSGTSSQPVGPPRTNSIPGAKGAPGPTGVTGATGRAGPKGNTGPAGATGARGIIGATGATGARGAAGGIGPSGTTGPQGPAGPEGKVGPAGPSGVVTAYVGQLKTGDSNISATGDTVVVRTPKLPKGQYAVSADVTLNNPYGSAVNCNVTLDSSGSGGTQVATQAQGVTTLSLNDAVKVTASTDQIDLSCGSPTGYSSDSPTVAQVTSASITALPVSNIQYQYT